MPKKSQWRNSNASDSAIDIWELLYKWKSEEAGKPRQNCIQPKQSNNRKKTNIFIRAPDVF